MRRALACLVFVAALGSCKDDPAAHLAYDPTGGILALSGSTKGETTIRVLRLNLRRLREDRLLHLEFVRELMEFREQATARGEHAAAESAADWLGSLAADNKLFAGMVRFFLANPDALAID